jgi:hypothetical protein
VVLYDLALLAVGLQISTRKKNIDFLVGVPMAIAVMHFSWGSAFLWSLLRSLIERKP